jgi:host factor-I protein
VIHQGGPISVPAARAASPERLPFRLELGRFSSKKPMGIPMSAEKSQNVQDVFLNHVRKNKTPVTVFLVNGVKLQGIITWFDNFCVLLRRDAHSQLVYKHAISTVMPAQPIQLFEPGRESDES